MVILPVIIGSVPVGMVGDDDGCVGGGIHPAMQFGDLRYATQSAPCGDTPGYADVGFKALSTPKVTGLQS